MYGKNAQYGKNAHDTYQAVQITTTDRACLLLMMYEGAIKFLKQSKAGIEEKDIVKFCKYLGKGQAIIAELMNTLDFKQGGTIARDLDRLYDFMLFYLSEANLYRDGERVGRVIKLLDNIYSAFKEVIESGKHLAPATPEEQDARMGEALKRVQLSL
ncbi:MAG: flagellar export chaperone FliS [Pseudomonadota bacterium]